MSFFLNMTDAQDAAGHDLELPHTLEREETADECWERLTTDVGGEG